MKLALKLLVGANAVVETTGDQNHRKINHDRMRMRCRIPWRYRRCGWGRHAWRCI